MMTTDQSHYGVWSCRLTGPPAAIQDLSAYIEVTLEGFNDENLEWEAAEKVARRVTDKSYDELPDEWTPMTFEVTPGHNEFVTLDGTQVYFVTVYEIDRCYGGPEEGGWWYDTGVPIRHIPCNSYDEAAQVQETLREGDFPLTGKRYSVLGGDDYSVVIDVRPGVAFPETRPHYE